MAKMVIIYDSKFGNTKKVAEIVAEGFKEKSGTPAPVMFAKNVDPDALVNYDLILIGGPNHVGGPTGPIKKIIKKLAKMNLSGKKIGFFDTYMADQLEKATKKMENMLSTRASGYELVKPLSVKVLGQKGPIDEKELPRCKEYGSNLA